MTDKKITVSVSSGGGSPPLKDGGGFPVVPTVLTWSLDQDPSNFNPSESESTPMTEEKKFCVNCRHHYHNNGSSPSIPAGHRCTHQDLVGWDLVTGERVFPLCRDMRNAHQYCGPQAKDYEPKVPVFRPFLKEPKT